MSAMKQGEREGEPLLRVEGLTVEFPGPEHDIRPVNDVSFELAPGEIVGIVGETGSGKSLTALAIAQLVPYPGRVAAKTLQFEGKDLLKLSPRELKSLLGLRMAMIFQDPMSSLNPALRVGTQLIEGPRAHRSMSRRAAFDLAARRMREVHIPVPERTLRHYPHEFSGGMRQRAMIAMGLMNEPALVIADEPTTALDVTVQAQVIRVLKEANERHKMAIILISHNIGVIAETCSRVLVMYAGRIVEDVDTRSLLDGARHPYTRALLASVPTTATDRSQPLQGIPGRPPALDDLPPGCAFAPRCPDRVAESLVSAPPLETLDRGHRVACWVHGSREGAGRPDPHHEDQRRPRAGGPASEADSRD
jgi:peptide/nickel transport system ATP-binding protein/peptide/nickel transport system permease protein